MTKLPITYWYHLSDSEFTRLQTMLATEFNEAPVPRNWIQDFGPNEEVIEPIQGDQQEPAPEGSRSTDDYWL